MAVFVGSSMMVLLRRLRRVHWFLVLLASGVFGVLEQVILGAAMGVLVLPGGLWDCLLAFVAFPCAGFLSQIVLVLAFKFEKAGPVALVSSSSIVFSFLLEFAIFGVVPDIYSWGGGVIVIFGLIITTMRKWVEELESEDERKKNI